MLSIFIIVVVSCSAEETDPVQNVNNLLELEQTLNVPTTWATSSEASTTEGTISTNLTPPQHGPVERESRGRDSGSEWGSNLSKIFPTVASNSNPETGDDTGLDNNNEDEDDVYLTETSAGETANHGQISHNQNEDKSSQNNNRSQSTNTAPVDVESDDSQDNITIEDSLEENLFSDNKDEENPEGGSGSGGGEPIDDWVNSTIQPTQSTPPSRPSTSTTTPTTVITTTWAPVTTTTTSRVFTTIQSRDEGELSPEFVPVAVVCGLLVLLALIGAALFMFYFKRKEGFKEDVKSKKKTGRVPKTIEIA